MNCRFIWRAHSKQDDEEKEKIKNNCNFEHFILYDLNDNNLQQQQQKYLKQF